MAGPETLEYETAGQAVGLVEIAADLVPAEFTADRKPERLGVDDLRRRADDPEALSAAGVRALNNLDRRGIIDAQCRLDVGSRQFGRPLVPPPRNAIAIVQLR